MTSKRIIANKAKKSDAMIMSSIVLLLIHIELTHVMANKMQGFVHLKLELLLTKVVLIFCNIGEILKDLSLIWKPDRWTETGETGLDPRL